MLKIDDLMKAGYHLIWTIPLLILLIGACTTPKTDWYGITLPLKSWTVEDIDGDPYQLSQISHRSLQHCQIMLMNAEPIFAAGNPTGWQSNVEVQEIEMLSIAIVTVENINSEIVMRFYDVTQKIGTLSGKPTRLAYYQLDTKEDADRCMDAFWELLISINPQTFPILPMPQG